MHFANPEAFALLPLVALALGWALRPRHHAAASFSGLGAVRALPAGWAVWGPSCLALLRAAALALLVVALARPQTDGRQQRRRTEGIAIQLVLDNSYSMRTTDYDLDARPVSRLDAVKHAVRLFVAGGGHGLRGRPDDKVGIITFARDPDVVCPLTLDHAAVLDALERIGVAPPVGTNIGDALAWGLDRLRRDPTRQKVLVLLSDGSHNVPEGLAPAEAARLASDLGVKVYTIGAAGNRPQTGRGDSVDEEALRQIAALTGGRYFRATNADGLAGICRDIDRLETTSIENSVPAARREGFVPFVVAAVGLLATEQLLAGTRWLRVP